MRGATVRALRGRQCGWRYCRDCSVLHGRSLRHLVTLPEDVQSPGLGRRPRWISDDDSVRDADLSTRRAAAAREPIFDSSPGEGVPQSSRNASLISGTSGRVRQAWNGVPQMGVSGTDLQFVGTRRRSSSSQFCTTTSCRAAEASSTRNIRKRESVGSTSNWTSPLAPW